VVLWVQGSQLQAFEQQRQDKTVAGMPLLALPAFLAGLCFIAFHFVWLWLESSTPNPFSSFVPRSPRPLENCILCSFATPSTLPGKTLCVFVFALAVKIIIIKTKSKRTSELKSPRRNVNICQPSALAPASASTSTSVPVPASAEEATVEEGAGRLSPRTRLSA